MSCVRVQTGATVPIEVIILDDSLDPLTGKTDILLSCRRKSDGWWLDFNAPMQFRNSGWTTRQQQLSELDATYDQGAYGYDLVLSAITNMVADDTLELRVDQSPGTDAANVPQTGEIIVGQWADQIDDIETDTNEIQGKLPTNYIMGSSDQDDHDVDIDTILSRVDVTLSTRSSHSAADVGTTLSGAHGAGSWEGDSAATIDALLTANHGAGSWAGATAAAVAAEVWSTALPGAFGVGEAGYILGTNLDATISSVNTAIGLLNDIDQAGVQAALTAQGYTTARAPWLDNLDAAITSRAAPGDAMDLVTDALDGDSLASTAVAEINTYLEVTAGHGGGSWQSGAISIDYDLIKAAVWNADPADFVDPNTMGLILNSLYAWANPSHAGPFDPSGALP